MNYRDVTLVNAGQLAEVLGTDALAVDSLVVKGPINDADFRTLWQCSFTGNLKVIVLADAIIEDGRIPDNAFYHKDAQFNRDNETVSSIKLEKLILPSTVSEIGKYAVSNAENLRVLHMPASLRKIDFSAFEKCVSLTVDSFTLPEGLEILGSQCFLGCSRLRGEIVLPESLKRIESAAFMYCGIRSRKFPQSLEFLGSYAFYGCDFKEVYLPDQCLLEFDGRQFAENTELERVHLPENSMAVPEAMFLNCGKLREVNIPSNAKGVLMNAFSDCSSLQSISFPEGMESLSFTAFRRCSSLAEVMFPSTLVSVGPGCFEDAEGVKKVYCKALVPPACGESTSHPNTGPFGSYEGDIWHGMSPDTPLYVPIGTGNLYRSAWGWSYFKNIIETDDFPALSVGDILTDDEADAPVFDMMGRKVDSPQPGQIYIKSGKKFIVR